MSVREQQNKRRKILLGEDTNALTWLVILNTLFFVSILFIEKIYDLTAGHSIATDLNIESWVAMPANGYLFLTRPWTIVTYMFAHNSLWVIVSNLLWLWCFGYILQDLVGNTKLFPVYLYGGFFGGLFFVITANLIPSIHANVASVSMMGAGTSVMAIAVATTTFAPNYRILPMLNGGIPLWVLALLFAAIDLRFIGSENGAVAIAHIVSGFTGFFFIYQLRRGNDMGSWIVNFTNWVNDLFNPEKKQRQQEHFYKTTRKPFEKTHHFTQQKLDEILDKINEEGYHRLTEEEKEFLKKASKEKLLTDFNFIDEKIYKACLDYIQRCSACVLCRFMLHHFYSAFSFFLYHFVCAGISLSSINNDNHYCYQFFYCKKISCYYDSMPAAWFY